jgi:hypothetical protein
MKKLLFLNALFIISYFSYAQLTIANNGFETWDNVGNASEEPTQWNSSKSGINNATLAPQTCYREGTNPHGGNYCVRVETKSYFGQTVPGTCTTGKLDAPTLSGSDGYIFTDTLDVAAKMPFVGRPDSLVGWYRYTSVSSDFASIGVLLHVGKGAIPESGTYQGNTTPNVVARAEFLSPTSSVANWTRFSVPFVYVDGRTPQYFLCVMTSSGGAGAVGSKLWLDDIDVVYNPTIATGSVNAGPHYVNATTGANVNVPFTLTGVYGGNNMVTAYLSDASGSFAAPVNIGSVTTTTSGTVNAVIPPNTPSGSGYRIRVASSNPAITAANNGADISVVLVNAAVTPSSTQNILPNVDGNTLTVTETPSGTSREWKYSTTSGTGYQSFNPAQTGTTYTPNFQNTGTYYIICESQIQGLTAVSNEVEITVSNVTLATGTVSVTTFDFSPSAPDGAVDVPYTVSGAFNVGNTFTAQLSDANGSFSNSTVIGSLSDVNSGTINAFIPSNTPSGTGYRIRVVGSDPAVSGADNGANILIDQFANSIAPASPQTILVNTGGTFMVVNESQNAALREWKYTTTSGSNYQSFNPAETMASYTPLFAQAGTYYVVCASVNQYSDEVISNEVEITVTIGTGMKGSENDMVKIWNTVDNIFIDLTHSNMNEPKVIVFDLNGRELINASVASKSVSRLDLNIASGIYVVKVFDSNFSHTVKLMKQ